MAIANFIPAVFGTRRFVLTASLALAAASTIGPLAQAQTAGGATGASGAATATSPAPSAASAAASSSSKVARADQAFMHQLAQTNLAEIAAGKIAQEKATTEGVKTYAQQMIDDHTSAQSELQTMADAKAVTLPKTPDAAHQAAAKKMQGLSGAAFDRSYVAHAGTADHKAAVRLLTQVSKTAADPDLKAYGAKMLPKVQGHLDMVPQTKGQPKSPAPQAKADS